MLQTFWRPLELPGGDRTTTRPQLHSPESLCEPTWGRVGHGRDTAGPAGIADETPRHLARACTRRRSTLRPRAGPGVLGASHEPQSHPTAWPRPWPPGLDCTAPMWLAQV